MELGRTPGFDEVCDAMGLLKRQRSALRDAVTMRERFGDGRDDREPDDGRETVLSGLIRAEEASLLAESLDELAIGQPREAEVIRMRFGIGGGEPCDFVVIGERLGVTRQRVQQLFHAGMQKLRGHLAARGVTD
jgi:DNA-directed RNA polymerase sigma subunit (sigma70/sigma32)